MAQFEPFEENVEVNGETVLTTVNAFPEYMRNVAQKILKKYGIEDPQPESWYSQKGWLDSFREISEQFGASTLFQIGKKIPENAQFPPEIDNLEKGLSAIDIAYHMNHRIGDIGFYKMVSHDKASKEIIMQCNNPYPCDFDRGIITTIGRKFNSTVEVELDKSKPSRNVGSDESWYIVTYQ